MNNRFHLLRLIFKIILWIIIAFELLFITIAVLIQVPAIQKRIITYATAIISNKTHTKVDINKISIAFPKSLVIEGLFLEDIKRDTMLYAGKLKVDIAFWGLFHHEIHINSVGLEEVKLNLYRPESDSVFNFNFLIKAFSDTSKAKNPPPETISKWNFILDNIDLKDIRFQYNDDYGGMHLAANMKQMHIKVDKIDLKKLDFSIDELKLENSIASVLILKSAKSNSTKSRGISPKIRANSIKINNILFTFGDSVNRQTIAANIHQLNLQAAEIDIQKQLISSNTVSLSKSKVRYSRNEKDSNIKEEKEISTTKSNWKITAKDIMLDDNSLSYMVENRHIIKNQFDVAHLDYSHFTLHANDFSFSTERIKTSIKKLNAIDQNNFSILEFETDFSMDAHSITAKNLKLKTPNSTIDADVKIAYHSLASLKDSLQYMMMDADLKSVKFTNADVLYINHQLNKQTFFRNRMNITTISGTISGPIKNLNGKNILIKTGVNTVITTDFNIVGLPKFKTTYFNFPNLSIISGKKDIAMIADTLIPKSIELPESISMQIVFKGQMKSFETTVRMNSSYGELHLLASIDKNENFKSKIRLDNFDVGSLTKSKKTIGNLSLTAEANGHGFDKNTLTASIKAEVSQFYVNNYNYHKLLIEGNIRGQQYEGKLKLNDENAAFDLDGLINLSPNQEQYTFNLNIKGADLKKLNLTKEDIKLALIASADFKGVKTNNLSGKLGITNAFIAHDGKNYSLDTLLLASFNEISLRKTSISNALIGIQYNGTFSPLQISGEINQFINQYFLFSDKVDLKKTFEAQDFNFAIQLHNSPILSEVFLPNLKELEPVYIQGSFNSDKSDLKLKLNMHRIVYGSIEINGLLVNVSSDANALNYSISSTAISNSMIKLENVKLDGKLADNNLFANISSTDENLNKKLSIRSRLSKDKENYKLTIDSNDFYLMNKQWNVASDNYIEFGKQGFLIHHFFIKNAESSIDVASVHDQFNDDLNIAIKNFKLEDISGIIQKDSILIRGDLDGNLLLKRTNNAYGLIADAQIHNLYVREVPIGEVSLKAENPSGERFDVDLNLTGKNNNLSAKGYYVPNGGANSINIKVAIQSLSMKTVEAFSMGNITEAAGTLSGNLLLDGNSSAPDVTGELVFNDAYANPSMLNSRLELKHESVQIQKDGIYFHSFHVLDKEKKVATVDGKLKMEHFRNFIFDLNLSTEDFLLFNTSAKDNNEFYGKMIIDSKVDLSGPITLPVINAKVKLKKGSTFTFAVLDKVLNADKGEDVVEFNNPVKLNEILTRDQIEVKQKTGLKGFDISSVVEIDKEATLKLLLDPSTNDSLVVRGEAALNFTMDRSGKMSLTGAYNITDGSYLVSLESVIKIQFKIKPESTIIWNGDPQGAEISINAFYLVRASPYDLIANQTTGLSEADKNGYKQSFPFLVLLKLRGEILHPLMSFEIQLPPDQKGILGGSVNALLNLLNEDPSALNKQVFSLLILGRFVQENPLQTGSSDATAIVRTTAGRFLSSQLNRLSSKVLTGVELNFDIQSYNDYQSGKALGRTQVEIGVKKQLFNERLSVQVGGIVDVEGVKANQNSASDITSDATIEYKLTKEGAFRLIAFRHNKYEGAFQGQLIETGIGILHERDFKNWKEFFRAKKNSSDSLNKNNTHDTIRTK